LSTLDILYIVIMVVSFLVSASRGGVRELFSLLAVGVGFVAAARFYQFGGGQLLRLTSHVEVNNIISFTIIFLFVAILLSYVGAQLTHIVKKAELSFWNVMSGSAIGLLKGLFICSLMTYMLLVFMKPGGGFFSSSRAFPVMSELTLAVSPIGPRHFREELDKKMAGLFGETAEAATTPKSATKIPDKKEPPASRPAQQKAPQPGKETAR